MEKLIANYRVIIEKERYKDGSTVYTAECPTLKVYDYGDSIDQTLSSIRDGIELAIKSLIDEGEEVPVDNIEKSIIVNTQVVLPKRAKLATI